MSDTVIILQDECIIAATGKEGRVPKIGNVERIPLEGYGEMAELWKAALIKYMQLHKPSQVKLVLPASGSSARMSQIPYASGKQLAKLAQNVMAESSGESVSDYAVIQSDKKQGISLCCGSADTDTLLKMIGMCMEAGLPLREITVPMEGYLKILAQLKEYRKKTAIYLFFEENSVTSLLYREGIYLYSTRSRLFSERGTVDFGTEIVRNISGIMQFYATVKGTAPITDVYYAGCMDDDFEVSMDGIRNMNLQVHPLKVDADASVMDNVPVYVALRPEKIMLCDDPPADGYNFAVGEVVHIAYLGDLSIYHVRLKSGQMISAQLQNAHRYQKGLPTWGDEVRLCWEADSCVVLTV